MAGEDLKVGLVFRAVDHATATIRRITNNFEHMRRGSQRASRAFQTAANLRQAGEGVSKFAAATRGFLREPIAASETFEAAMSRVKGLTRTTGAEFVALRAKALELGGSIGEFSAL